MKYQIGEGCAIDQVVAQWHANLMGLGRIFDPEQTAKAMDSVYRYNFKPRLGEVFNPCRLYGLADEAGTVICAYPPGAYKPAIAVPYAEETMHGFEYQAAIHLLQLGRLEEGFEMIAAVRRRYDGARRNPFNEMECGSNYARSMASFAALAALSGFRYDMTRGMIGFSPQQTGDFSTLWSLEPAWGTYCVCNGRAALSVLGGCLPLRQLALPGRRPVELRLQGQPVSWRMEGEMILLEADIQAGQRLEIL
ncbi:MAG: GH116 family glycosyl hydrolase, partial [Christensenellaceae bacterium]